MAKSVLDIMDEQIQRAKEVSASGGTYKPIFFRLTPSSKKGISPNQEAVIRPLFDLDQVVVMAMHRQYNEAEPTRSINAVCARELGQKCKYCELAMTDKKMAASVSFMLPVFVYQIVDQGDDLKGSRVLTYTDADGKEVQISGIRILELQAFGKIGDVLDWLRNYARDERKEDASYILTSQDFVIARKGAKQTLSYSIRARKPKPFEIETRPLTEARVRERVIEACPPVVLEDASAAPIVVGGKAANNGHADDIPDF